MRALVITDDRVGPVMAGSALRAWELAVALEAAGHEVRVAAGEGSRSPSGIGPRLVRRPSWRWAEAIVTPPWVLGPRPLGAKKRLVADGATPLLAELAAMPRTPRVDRRRRTAGASLQLALARADAVLAAGEAQQGWWQRRLDAAGRREVPVLQVPFGVPEVAPAAERDELPGVPPTWAVVLWWGGVWPWLDLETLLAARARLGDVPVSVVVPTGRRPGAASPSVDEVMLAALAARHGLEPPQVVGLERWVPYHQRHRILNRTSLLAVLHHPGEEAELAFRTRALDGVWAGVPLLVTEGGAVADLVRERGWGAVVPPREPRQTAAAIELALAERQQLRFRAALAADRDGWRWSRVAEPLVSLLPRLPQAPRGRFCWAAARAAWALAGRGGSAA